MEAIIYFIIYILNTFNGNHSFNQVRSTIFISLMLFDFNINRDYFNFECPT